MARIQDILIPSLSLDAQTSSPAAPTDDSWKVYSLADGVYARSSNTIVGPLSAGASLSYGSNSSHVAEVSAVGVATSVARSDHYHAGVAQITSSSSNTLQRGTVNIRAGANVGLAASDTDGDGELDTITIVATAGGSSGSGALTLISDTVLGSDTANFDLTSISGSYKHLLIEFQLRSDRASNPADPIKVTFNNDTGSNYDYSGAQIYGAIAYANAAGATAMQLGEATAATATSGAAAGGVFRIENYAGTTWHKTLVGEGVTPLGTASGELRRWVTSGRWRSTSAITRITIAPVNGSNWLTGSRVTLYGLG